MYLLIYTPPNIYKLLLMVIMLNFKKKYLSVNIGTVIDKHKRTGTHQFNCDKV